MSLVLRCLLLAVLLLAGVAVRAGEGPLLLDDSAEVVDAWPALRMLADPARELTATQLRARLADFQRPQGPHANLGLRRDDVWLHLPLRVQGQGRWVLELDYPPLNRVDVHLFSAGRLVAEHRLGNELPFAQRPLRSRAHALALQLDAGVEHELLLRVRSSSSMVLPIALHRSDAFVTHEGRQQLLQGLMLGVALALLAYSAVNAVGLRDPLFASYGVMVAGLSVFFVAFGGIGQQHLWHEQTGLMAKVAPLGVLVGIAAGSLFVAHALDMPRRHPRVTQALCGVSAVATVCLLASLAGVLDYGQTQTAATALGLLPMLLAVPTAVLQSRQGDRAARMMLFGWGVYLVGAASMAALLRGLLPANFWTLHLFQFATLLEMLVWMRVLSLRIEDVQREAERVELEHRTLHSLAHTDALTGLPNRRGLNEALLPRLARGHPDGALLALYMLDLDGFKPVNDRLGHDAGDSLLVQVAHRLRTPLRGGDIVARLGGDEFVVVVDGLRTEADARAVGGKLLEAFEQPFDVAGQRCRVGLTIGYAIAPVDGNDAVDLLKRADAAMYAGKQGGRNCVRRSAGAAAAAVTG